MRERIWVVEAIRLFAAIRRGMLPLASCEVLDALNRCGVSSAVLVVGGILVLEGSAFAVC